MEPQPSLLPPQPLPWACPLLLTQPQPRGQSARSYGEGSQLPGSCAWKERGHFPGTCRQTLARKRAVVCKAAAIARAPCMPDKCLTSTPASLHAPLPSPLNQQSPAPCFWGLELAQCVPKNWTLPTHPTPLLPRPGIVSGSICLFPTPGKSPTQTGAMLVCGCSPPVKTLLWQ